jgi:hypothetical protein
MKKIHPRKLTGLATVAVCVITLLGACKTTPTYRQADRTGDRIHDYREAAQTLQRSIDEAMESLEALYQRAHLEPRKNFRAFSSAVNSVERSNENALRRADAMRAESRNYFEQWQRDIAAMRNMEARQLAEERKAEQEQAFRDVSQITVEARDQLRPWLANVRDLESLLGNDLTVAGIEASKELISSVMAQSAEVRQGYERLMAALNTLAAAVTPGHHTHR